MHVESDAKKTLPQSVQRYETENRDDWGLTNCTRASWTRAKISQLVHTSQPEAPSCPF